MTKVEPVATGPGGGSEPTLIGLESPEASPAVAPFFRGRAVERISVESVGLVLWVKLGEHGAAARYTVTEAALLRDDQPEGATRNEINDALVACHSWQYAHRR